MSTDTDTPKQKVHKYLDQCTCNEHEEKNILGLHGAADRLLLPVQYSCLLFSVMILVVYIINLRAFIITPLID